MKRTTLTINLLVVALLLVATSAGAAAEQQTSSDLVETPAVQVPVTPSGSCNPNPDAQPLLDIEGQDPIPTTQNCGFCSTGGCAGAELGQLCYLSGQGSFGHCNTFTSNFMCTEGGLDCQCSDGAIP